MTRFYSVLCYGDNKTNIDCKTWKSKYDCKIDFYEMTNLLPGYQSRTIWDFQVH